MWINLVELPCINLLSNEYCKHKSWIRLPSSTLIGLWLQNACKSLISAQFVISKTQKCAWLVSRTGSTRSTTQRTNVSMPTIGESSESSSIHSNSIPMYGNSRRPFRTRSCRLPSSSASSTSRRSVLVQPRSRSLGLEGFKPFSFLHSNLDIPFSSRHASPILCDVVTHKFFMIY